jgi:hypothetical protein
MAEDKEKDVFCPQHAHFLDTILSHSEKLGNVLGKVDIFLDKQDAVFKDLSDIKLAAAANALNIASLLKVTGNGALDKLSKQIKTMGNIVDAGSAFAPKPDDRLPGFSGWLNQAWDDFIKKLGPLFIAIFIGLILWVVLKSWWFRELPFWMVK